ncbi:hypothetical protein FNAPI_8640 [Fusarium napiforme]|uniref:N,N-dimethylformamidase beta subunit-like C-terminal domain-containing protein n=1 Tax=Fusarium napiforme TaxID=42672 RepID=A0A8H5J185_9HYPO|nr:hypothetical protein FNAPI_8640 [Fusarium napiforme]
MRISAISLLALVTGALSVPVSSDSSSLEKRCEWNDGHGPISCIVFGAEGRERSEFIIKGNNFEQRGFPRCDPWQGGNYQPFFTPLPYVVMVAPGNTCETRLPEAWWDDLHIKYSSTFLNAPTDTRCGPVENVIPSTLHPTVASGMRRRNSMIEVQIRSLLDSVPILLRTPLSQCPSPFHDREDCQVMCQTRERTKDECILITKVDNPRGDTKIFSKVHDHKELGLNEESRNLLGTKGLAGGASGDQLDRLDVAIGSPADAILLARSERHDDHFMMSNEELIFPMIGTLGSTSPLVRSDMVYYETNGGGSVFSVGSINWNNSLAWDGYQNDVAQVT